MQKLDRIFARSLQLDIDDTCKLVIMSDCHRGDGGNYDNFLKNQNIYEEALLYYYNKDFTYIELGDGDDMWEVSNYRDILKEHIDTFRILKKFYDENRFLMLYGNHDMCKKSKNILQKYFSQFENGDTGKKEDLFNLLTVYESLVFHYKNKDIFMIHGHQVDLFNSTFWKLSRFLVRHVWKPLEHIGLQDPTSAAKNYRVSKAVEKRLEKWSQQNNKIIIAGHTHRPIYPKIGQSLYFNDGSCIHPNGITCLEIENGMITLVKWRLKLFNGKEIIAYREVLEGKHKIEEFFN